MTQASSAFLSDEKRLLIGGEWTKAASGNAFETVDPSNEAVITTVAEGAAADIDAAVDAARRALTHKSWASITAHERSRLLMRVADLVEAHQEELALIESLDNGMPLSSARRFAASVVQTFRYFAGWPTKIHGETNPSAPDMLNFTLREPVGVCGQIVPWNAPLSMAAWKLAPALACGNTTVLKPAEQTPLSALRLGELIMEAGVPPGVVNIVPGFGETAGAAIAKHPGIDKVAFTGSTQVGREIVRASAGNLKRVTLELGGKSPNIIFPDADLDQAITATVIGFCMLAGQMCIASSRVFVHESIQQKVVDALAKAAGALKMGDPRAADTTLGPLISEEQFARVASYLRIGAEEGARVSLGGQAKRGKGFYIGPTIFSAATNDMRVAREEIFGPVGVVIPFKDEDDAVLQGNDTEYGLAAAVWTRDIGRAHRVAKNLKAGTVWVNNYLTSDQSSPFGGYKQSGLGREMGRAAIEAYTETKSVFVKL